MIILDGLLSVINISAAFVMFESAKKTSQLDNFAVIVPFSAELNQTVRAFQTESERTVGLWSPGGAEENRVALDEHRPIAGAALGRLLSVVDGEVVAYRPSVSADAVNTFDGLPNIISEHRARDVLVTIYDTKDAQGISRKVWFDMATLRLNQIFQVSETVLDAATLHIDPVRQAKDLPSLQALCTG